MHRMIKRALAVAVVFGAGLFASQSANAQWGYYYAAPSYYYAAPVYGYGVSTWGVAPVYSTWGAPVAWGGGWGRPIGWGGGWGRTAWRGGWGGGWGPGWGWGPRRGFAISIGGFRGW
jgi:hypothetical protein